VAPPSDEFRGVRLGVYIEAKGGGGGSFGGGGGSGGVRGKNATYSSG
jgi:hypothetical protein